MILPLVVGGVPATVSLTHASLTASLDDQFVVSWDLGGRLYAVVDWDVTFRRGLNGRVLMKWRDGGSRQRRWATDEEAAVLVDRAASFAGDLAGAVESAGPRTVLERAAQFESKRAAGDARDFARVYQPVGILPPDQYLALVLQATEGCSFGSCTFCDLYRNPYRVKRPPEFASHVRDVRDYLGESIALRSRSVFLGSANALAVPMTTIAPLFDVLADEFPGRPVHAFVDGFTGALKGSSDYLELGRRGLARVCIGLESGHDPLLELVRKPATTAQAVETVRAVKDGGVAAGVVVITGLGGDDFRQAHVGDTAAAIGAMRLGPGDLLYFSEIVEGADSAYGTAMRARGARALTREECAADRQEILARVTFPGAPPQIATYDIREFVY